MADDKSAGKKSAGSKPESPDYDPIAEAKKRMADMASEATTAFSPIVGMQRSELMKSFGSFFQTAATSPMTFTNHMMNYSKDLWGIMKGDTDYAADPKDRRFKDLTWQVNPVYKRGMQAWLALRKNLHGWLDDLEMDDVDRARSAYIMDVLADSMAPTNSLAGNPAAIKRMFESGGQSLLKGLKNAYDDMVKGNGLPSQVDSSKFKVGENLVTTEGQVVYRAPMFELIQYKPLTDEVYEIPILMVPPQINKFYSVDLTPEKSLFQYMLGQGFQYFVISWKNPTAENADWGLEEYIRAIMDAIDALCAITKQDKVNVLGACSGGITLATLLSHLKSVGDDRVNAVTLMVCVLDPRTDDSDVGVFVTDETLELARTQSQKKGILSGDDLSRTFAWMRPNDLIWNYVVNNYLLGEDPPAFDVLHWNNDSTNLPAKLHGDYLDSYKQAPFANPGAVEFMGHPLSLDQVDNDVFVLAGVTDHITPWRACYRSAKLFGGDVTFCLSNSGHIQSIINPPINPKAQYFRGGDIKSMSWDKWMEGSESVKGSWWLWWSDWLGERAGKKKAAPKTLGNRKYKPVCPAPGEYVLE